MSIEENKRRNQIPRSIDSNCIENINYKIDAKIVVKDIDYSIQAGYKNSKTGLFAPICQKKLVNINFDNHKQTNLTITSDMVEEELKRYKYGNQGISRPTDFNNKVVKGSVNGSLIVGNSQSLILKDRGVGATGKSLLPVAGRFCALGGFDRINKEDKAHLNPLYVSTPF